MSENLNESMPFRKLTELRLELHAAGTDLEDEHYDQMDVWWYKMTEEEMAISRRLSAYLNWTEDPRSKLPRDDFDPVELGVLIHKRDFGPRFLHLLKVWRQAVEKIWGP